MTCSPSGCPIRSGWPAPRDRRGGPGGVTPRGPRAGEIRGGPDPVPPVGVGDGPRIRGPPRYAPREANRAAAALANATSPRQAAKAVSDLRFAVCDDQRGTLHPAAVPATGILL